MLGLALFSSVFEQNFTCPFHQSVAKAIYFLNEQKNAGFLTGAQNREGWVAISFLNWIFLEK